MAAISNELYVVNEESIVMLSLFTIYWAVYNYAGPMYREWAEGQSNKIKGILNAARDDHTNAVKARMDNVKDLSGVIDITKDLFAVSKVCASLRPPTLGRDLLTGDIGDRRARSSSLRARAKD